MAFMFITEYARQSKDNRGQSIAAGEEPALATQRIAIAAGVTQSAVLNAKTRFVRIHVDAICSYAVGTNPSPTAADARLGANQTEYFGLVEEMAKAGTLKIGNIQNT